MNIIHSLFKVFFKEKHLMKLMLIKLKELNNKKIDY